MDSNDLAAALFTCFGALLVALLLGVAIPRCQAQRQQTILKCLELRPMNTPEDCRKAFPE